MTTTTVQSWCLSTTSWWKQALSHGWILHYRKSYLDYRKGRQASVIWARPLPFCTRPCTRPLLAGEKTSTEKDSVHAQTQTRTQYYPQPQTQYQAQPQTQTRTQYYAQPQTRTLYMHRHRQGLRTCTNTQPQTRTQYMNRHSHRQGLSTCTDTDKDSVHAQTQTRTQYMHRHRQGPSTEDAHKKQCSNSCGFSTNRGQETSDERLPWGRLPLSETLSYSP